MHVKYAARRNGAIVSGHIMARWRDHPDEETIGFPRHLRLILYLCQFNRQPTTGKAQPRENRISNVDGVQEHSVGLMHPVLLARSVCLQ